MKPGFCSYGVRAGVLSLVVLSSCTDLLGDFHENGRGGASTSTTSSSSSSSTGGVGGTGGTGSTGGTGGTGGATVCTQTCTVPSDCPAPSAECVTATCEKGCCGTDDLTAGSPCTTGGSRCDGAGNCVECLNTAQCPPTGTVCATPTCTGGKCGDSNAALDTACTDSGGKECDGQGKCAACLQDAECPATGTACATPSCTGGKCGTSSVAQGTACTDNGGKVCDGSGKCVACNHDSECPATGTVCATARCDTTAHTCTADDAAKGAPCTDGGGVVCDGAGACVSAHCGDTVKDSDETDADCGGSCGPCGNGKGCKVATDCVSGYCAGTACAACTTDPQCGAGKWCDTTSGTCTPKKPTAAPCTAGSQCTTGSCASGVCCDATCNGTCQGCTLALTGQVTGKCAPYLAGTPAPAGQCTASPPCGNDGKCAAGGVCEQAASTTVCGALNCTNAPGMPGMLTPTGLCGGTGTCNAGTAAPCPGNVKCASATACLSGCGGHDAAGDAGCPSGYWCDGVGAGACQPQSMSGACTADDQCTAGHCAGGVCCDATCNGTCQGCTMALTGQPTGKCAPYLAGTPAPAGQCTASPPCGNDGLCAAGGVCEQAASTTVCGALTCTDAPGMPGMLTPAALCSGAGACNAGAAAPCPGNVKCASTTACLSGCGAQDATGDANCPSGHWCDGVGAGACQPQSTSGACTADDQCATGHCADGVCCNTACTGVCSACNLPSSPGTCVNEPNGSNNPSHPCTTGSACCAGGCADLQGDVTTCGACGHVCPGYLKAADNVSCVSGACTFSCKGESYDVNNNPADGCEVTDTVTNNHTEGLALNVGSVDECGNAGSVNFTSRLPSDRQAHNPTPVGFDPVTGSAPDWFSVTPIKGTFCANDVQLQLTVSGSSSPSCYQFTVITDKHTYVCQTSVLGSCSFNYTTSQYSDPPAGFIHIGVKKVCDTTVIENVTYNVYGNI